MATLVYKPGARDERSFSLREAPSTIGRAEDQTICLSHKSLSRSHARIEPAGGGWVVADLGSKNGTFVNGERIEQRALRHGDTITLGELDLLFRIEPGAKAGATPEPKPQATRALLRSPIAKLARSASGAESAPEQAQLRLRTLIEVSKLLPLSEDTDALLGKILDLVFTILDVDRAAILLLDESTGELVPRAVRTAASVVTAPPGAQALGADPSPPAGPAYSQTIVEYVLHKSMAALFTDAETDPRIHAAQSVLAQSIHASMCVPLKPRDEVIGVLYADGQRASVVLTEEDLDLFVAFAGQAAVAIDNARLHRQISQETVARMQLVMEAKLASLGAMVAAIAHELRNPLNFMTNFAELSAGLVDEVTAGLEAHRAALPEATVADLSGALTELGDNVARIRDHGRRADAVIQGMLQHARRPSGTREPADLNAVVAEGVRLGREAPLYRGLELRVVEAYDRAMPPIAMAALDLGRVFLNVVENALYAMAQKKRALGGAYAPELTVRTAVVGDHVEVRVRDNGVGVPADVAARVFEPFFTTKPTGHGTGLGLSLSRDIVVEGHQGDMHLESAQGEWTEIVVRLPLRP